MATQGVEGLTPEQLAFFNDNGYLLIPDALSQDTVKELLQDTNAMLNDFSLDDHPMTKFSTGGEDGANHVGDEYFLESGDKVRFFFEEGMPTGLIQGSHMSLADSVQTLSISPAPSPSPNIARSTRLATTCTSCLPHSARSLSLNATLQSHGHSPSATLASYNQW
jgi:hypothetical protein